MRWCRRTSETGGWLKPLHAWLNTKRRFSVNITSGQDLLAQARTLTAYLRVQPDGWLAAHRLMKSLRHDTLTIIPAPDAEGKTRIEPPRADQRAMLKRLYLQQSWSEILEQADSTFSRGANHLWLDLQWYIHQALVRSGQDVLADIIIADLKGLLRRLTGLETLAFNDGTPFADEVTLNWINQRVYSTICPSGRMSQYRLPAALMQRHSGP